MKQESNEITHSVDSEKPETKLIDKTSTLAVSIAVVGPLALPLLWRNPRFSRAAKVLVTAVVLVATFGLLQLNVYLMKRAKLMIEQKQEMQNLTSP